MIRQSRTHQIRLWPGRKPGGGGGKSLLLQQVCPVIDYFYSREPEQILPDSGKELARNR
jgi:hypothetical protein